MVDVIPLRFGPIFKRAFSKPHIFREFVHAVTGVEVNVDRIHTEYEYPERIGNVNVMYDIFAEDEEQRIIVEIQHMEEEDFYNRFIYYHYIGILEQVSSFDSYEPPRTVYTIVVLTSVPRDGSVDYSYGVHPAAIFDEFNQIHKVANHQLIVLNPRNVNPQTPEAVKPWLELIADSLDRQVDENDYELPTLKELITEIQRTTISSEESTAIKDETAWRMAVARHRREAQEDQQIESAKVMLDMDIELPAISKVTGLTIEEIQALDES